MRTRTFFTIFILLCNLCPVVFCQESQPNQFFDSGDTETSGSAPRVLKSTQVSSETATETFTVNPGEIPEQKETDETTVSLLVEARSYFTDNLEEIPRNREAQYRVDVSWQGNADDLVIKNVRLARLLGIKVVSQGYSSKTLPGTGKVLLRFTFNLQPLEEGVASVGPAILEFQYRGSDMTEEIRTQKDSIRVVAPARNWSRIILRGTLLIVAIVVVLFGVVVVKRILQNRLYVAEYEEGPVTPTERFRAELSVLQRKAIEGHSYDLHEKADQWIRNLLASMLDPTIRKATHMEIAERLRTRGEVEADVRDLAISILERCEKVKFAGYRSEHDEQQALYDDCAHFLKLADAYFVKQKKTEKKAI